MTSFSHVSSGFDVAPLHAALLRNPHLWGAHRQRAELYQSPHTQMTDIWVRYNALEHFGPHFNDEHDSVWYPAYRELPELAPLLFGLMRQVQGERLGGVLLTKIAPGAGIAPHVDSSWHADYYEKFTIAIQNAPGAVFHFPDGDILAQPGDCYWFDNSVIHSVSNASDEERIALIVCIKTDLYRRNSHA